MTRTQVRSRSAKPCPQDRLGFNIEGSAWESDRATERPSTGAQTPNAEGLTHPQFRDQEVGSLEPSIAGITPQQTPPTWTVRDCAGHGSGMEWADAVYVAHVVGCHCARPGGAT